jgi:hypothetical protein
MSVKVYLFTRSSLNFSIGSVLNVVYDAIMKQQQVQQAIGSEL